MKYTINQMLTFRSSVFQWRTDKARVIHFICGIKLLFTIKEKTGGEALPHFLRLVSGTLPGLKYPVWTPPNINIQLGYLIRTLVRFGLVAVTSLCVSNILQSCVRAICYRIDDSCELKKTG